ncbi:MAG: LPS export ABC transporter permease LptF [Proteobacteria bacterium]|nr:LPS export ABC transporter permease LptF [Pseudomonadota bacterium]
MIINRYLIREISKPLATILIVLVTLFASYSAAEFLSDAVNGLLPTNTIGEMIGLKALISLEVLIPVSLYISVILSFGKLYSDSEFTAMFALRVTPARIMGSVLTLSGALAVLVALLSLFARPWAYEKLHALSKQAEAFANVDNMQAGTFYIAEDGGRVIFLKHRDGPKSTASDVFVQLIYPNRTRILFARHAYQLPEAGGRDRSEIHLSDAHLYDIGREKGQPDSVVDAQGIILRSPDPSLEQPEYSSVSAGTETLAISSKPPDIAEFQWRLSTPLSTILLGMLAVPLSRIRPRQSRYAKMGAAALIYSGYYLLFTSARTWVQQSAVAAFPGIWWVPASLAAVVAIIWVRPYLGFELRRLRMRFNTWHAHWFGGRDTA